MATLALLLRAVYFWQHTGALPFVGYPILDAAHYGALAAAWAADGLPPAPFYQSPGYPMILAVLLRLGVPFPEGVVVGQHLLGAGTVILTMVTARRWFGNAVAVGAGVLLLMAGPLYFFEAKALAATLAVHLAAWALFLLVRAEELPEGPAQRRRMLWAGAAAGALAVVRANLLLFGAGVVLVLAVRALRGRGYGALMAYLAAWLLLVLPVTLHNARHGALAPVATSGGLNFYLGNHADATGVYGDIPGISGVMRTQEQEADSLVAAATGRRLAPAEESRYWWGRAGDSIRDDPAAWGGLLVRKTRLFFGRQEEAINGSYALERERVWLLRAAAMPFNLLIGLAMLGWWWSRGRRLPGSYGAVMLFVAVSLSAVFFFSLARLRLPLVPVGTVFAAFALGEGVRRWRDHRRRSLAEAGLGLIVLTLATWSSPLGEARNAGWEARLFAEAGRAMQKEGDFARAQSTFTQGLEVNPQSVENLIGRAQAALAANDPAAALRDLERARDLAPGNAVVRNNLGILFYMADRWDESFVEMNRASELSPGDAIPFLYRGLVLARSADPRAGEFLREALKRNPRSRTAHLTLIEWYLDGGDADAARAAAEQATAAGVQLPAGLRARLTR